MNYKNEIWKPIKNYEGLYEVSSCGRVRSLRRKAPFILKQTNNGYGYLTVNLYKDGFNKKIKVHRVVAETFVPNPDNLETVDHLDRDRTNNRIENLRWSTYKEQSTNRNEHNADTKTPVICEETGEIFKNAITAAHWIVEKNLSISSATEVAKRIRYLCRGQGQKTAYGYHWKFIME